MTREQRSCSWPNGTACITARSGWSYNSNNQLTAASAGLGGLPAPSGFSYDPSGNQTGLNGMSLSYDGWGQLAGVQNGPSGAVSFTTDSAGRRVSKTANGQTSFYLYDGDVLVAELDSSGNLKTTYTWGFQGLISDRVQATGGAASRFYEYDAMGNTRALLDQAGNVLGLAAYTAWGSTLSSNLPQTPFGYQGRWGIYSDGETGLLRMGARYYSAALGRFLSRDPGGFGAGPNLYAYCACDPVDFFDQNGMWPTLQDASTWYWNGCGGASQFVDTWITAGSTENYGNTAGLYDSGRASGGDVVKAAAVWGYNVGSAACLAKDFLKLGLIGAKAIVIGRLAKEAPGRTVEFVSTLPHHVAGVTDVWGNIQINANLLPYPSLVASTLRHEGVHALFSPNGGYWARALFGGSAARDFAGISRLEELVAETYSSGNLVKGLKYAYHEGYGTVQEALMDINSYVHGLYGLWHGHSKGHNCQ